jgi:NADH:ubiquinone oxidoreductase subunit 5 (subunit L)/multisubunit Na+/H+ antiporter MnhA subunit
VQNDIKRVIAYSTCSQLGYMFVACGRRRLWRRIFHLFTHAFFKALLFLGAGSVIHAMSDEQDMRNMGGLRKKIPVTWAMMMIGTLALTGFPFTAGSSRRMHHRKRLCGARLHCHDRLLAAGHRGVLHLVLFVAADVHDLPRQAARQPRRDEPRA